jgi:Zn-dependent peptidase ImmA (M78 family)
VAQREEILAAVYEADRLHRDFDAKARAERGEGRIDVFDMLVKREVPVLFRPLEKLLGAFVDDPDKGVLVTSRRPLPVQRFTAAHELGHEVLGHEGSLDEEEILTRAPYGIDALYDPREVQANTFASRLLTPDWLIAHHMRRQGWTPQNLREPAAVYQLSLRMGSSYSATCYAIEEARVIDRWTREKLLEVKPRAIKQSLLKEYERESWYGDVWVVSNRDDGMVIEGSRSDLVILHFEEHASSGYLWQLGELADAGLAIRQDKRTSPSGEDYVGGVVLRMVVAEPQQDRIASGHVHLREIRPWQASAEALHSLELDVDLSGPQQAGLLPEQREAMLGAA